MFFSNNSSSLFRTPCSKDGESEKIPPEIPQFSSSISEARRRYRSCQKWTEALARLRRDFNGDLDQYLLFLVFEQSEMARTLSALEGAARRDSLPRGESRGMNAMSIAEICGIPRETARRKLKQLIHRRIIRMGPDGLYYLVVTNDSAGAAGADAPPVDTHASGPPD